MRLTIHHGTQGKRFQVVGFMIEEIPQQATTCTSRDAEFVAIRSGFDEINWRTRVETTGGKGNPTLKLWEIEYGKVRKLGLTDAFGPQMLPLTESSMSMPLTHRPSNQSLTPR